MEKRIENKAMVKWSRWKVIEEMQWNIHDKEL